jgi:hypothetical protein
MKQLFFFLSISLFAITFSSCNDDDDDTNVNNAEFGYDLGPNTAPFFGIGVHEAAARFNSTVTSPFVGQKLDRVEFYLVNTPSNTKVVIYDEGTATQPGPQLYSADVTVDVNANSWNIHTISQDIDITGRDLWIAIEFTHPDERNTIGCDVGPANVNGDLVLEGSELNWMTYRNFTDNVVDINWNIRGYVGE